MTDEEVQRVLDAVMEAGLSHAWSVIPHRDAEFTIRTAEPHLRAAIVEQFRRALLDGLEDLDRVHHWNGHVDSGDLAQLIEAVAAEVRGG